MQLSWLPFYAALVATAFAGASGAAVAQGESEKLLDPGWNDPFFADYLERQGTDAAPSLGGVRFSLPVLGFSRSPSGTDAAPEFPLGQQLAAVIPSWPACAKGRPKTVTLPSVPEQAAGVEPGTWFTSTYDFGCLQIVVEGDRNSPDPAVAPDPEPAPESGAISIVYQDENAGVPLDTNGDAAPALETPAAGGMPIISYTRGGLTYAITVACTPPSQSLCADSGALRTLTERLVPVAGRPQP